MSNVEDAAVILRASDGRALRGLSYNRGIAAGKQLLLSPPSEVPLMGSSKPAVSTAYCFSRSEESKSFSRDVIDKGWSVAMQIHAKSFLWSASASLAMSRHKSRQTDQHLSKRVSEACITQCVYIPIKSFQIPRSKMILSEAALARARAVDNQMDADDFLNSFNPFVSESLYHLGGVFLREVSIKCKEQTSLFRLMSQAQEEMMGTADVNVLLGGGKVSGKKHASNETTSDQSSFLNLEERLENVVTLGPKLANDVEEFRRKLVDNPLCWAIIDKDVDEVDALVSVWDLLLRHSHSVPSDEAAKLKRAAKALCERWLYLADHPKLPSPFWEAPLDRQLIHRSKVFVARLSSDPMLKLEHLKEAPLAPLPALPKNVSLVSLSEHLQALVDKASSAQQEGLAHEQVDVSHKAAIQVRYYITYHIMDTGGYHRKALEIFQGYGFDARGNLLCQLHVDKLKAMIQELKDIQKPSRPKGMLPPSGWGHAEMGSILPSSVYSSGLFQYVGDLVVDRNFYQDPYSLKDSHGFHVQAFRKAAARRLIECLRHRVNPLKHLLPAVSSHAPRPSVNNWDSAFNDEVDVESSMVAREDDVQQQVSPFELLVNIFQASDLPAQIELCNLLLSQRAATLLVLPSNPQIAAHLQGNEAVSLTHCIQALRFVQVSLEKEKKLCIAEDTTLPRVVFLSDKNVQASHAAIVASRVLHCDFISQHHRRYMGQLTHAPVIEVGVGFISPPSQESQHVACLSFHVTGPYSQLMKFVDSIADVVVLELEQGYNHQHTPLSTSAKVLQWWETGGDEGADPRKLMTWGQETYLVGEIERVLYSARKVRRLRTSLIDACTRNFAPRELISFKQLEGMLCQWDFRNVRESLRLQRSLINQARAYFEFLQLNEDPGEKRVRENRIAEEKHNRLSWARDVMNIPIIRLFHQLVSQPDVASRRVGIMWLERSISEKMHPVLEEASQRVDRMFEVVDNNPKDGKAKQEYIKAKQAYVEQSVGLDNLWRELCHIFEADPINQRDLAKQAAQHLLDGFPLEILDGDAGMFCKIWVESVLVELDAMTKAKRKGKSARIFVLSVMGLQSSGKSTMLNLMFGTQLQTSAGRCTRGVYMQLVPSERAEYDYVMLLDTEGLRSPEFFGLEASEVRDNRLATFGLLPADASLFMVSNEDDSGLKEVLPMVLLAFKGSSIAESSGGRIKAKMFFVYRSVNTNDAKKLKENKQKLHQYLREAAEEVSNMGVSSSDMEEDQTRGSKSRGGKARNELLQGMLTNFLVSEDEKTSDVKCMGNLKKGCAPPSDTPEWAYGEHVVELREYIHKRVMEDGWEAMGFQEWAEHLVRVWDCVCSADFELNFRSAMEYSAYMQLKAELRPPREEVLQKYMEEFKSLEKTAMTMKEEEGSIVLFGILETNVEHVVKSMSNKVEQILKMKKWAKWRPQTLEEWKHFCVNTIEWYRKRVEDLESGVVRFEKVVTEYEKRCKSTIVQKIESGEWELKQSKENRTQKFEEFFKRILLKAEDEYPQMANKVPKRVMDQYKEAGLAKEFDLFANPGQRNKESWPILDWFRGKNDQQKNKQEELYSTLQVIIDHGVRDTRQYSEVVVSNVIRETKKAIESAEQALSKKEKQEAHILVKNTLTEKMSAIQRQWDEDHNVAGKLRLKAKPRLLKYFEARVEGLEAAAMLVREMQLILVDELEDAHRVAVETKVANQLGRKDWVMNWRVMRNFLDYHLLTLMETRNTSTLLRYVSDGTLHFQQMKDALIRQAIESKLVEQEWKDLVERVEHCLREQASLRGRSVRVFLEELGRRLVRDVDPKLAKTVVESINQDFYKDHILDSEFYNGKVPALCESLHKKAMPAVEGVRGAVQKGVSKMLEGLTDENYRPRCGASCPMCGSTCFHAIGHAHIDQKHDCIHQPAGLSGVRWFGLEELTERTCLEMLNTGCDIVLNNGARRVPFSDFGKEFPDWTKPANNESTAIHVRECIFFNYQRELVNFYPQGVKPCPPAKMPPRYNHNADHLRTALTNTLRPTFTGDSWNHFTHLLKAL